MCSFQAAAAAVGASHPVLCDNHAVIAAKWPMGSRAAAQGVDGATLVVLIIGGGGPAQRHVKLAHFDSCAAAAEGAAAAAGAGL